jgi:hypothetical protein
MINRFLVIFLGLMVSLAVAFMHPGPAEAQVVMDGLVSYWSFDEITGGTVEDLVGGNDGTLVGNVVATDGRFGKGLEFDGASRVEVPDPAAFDFNTDFTWSAWINTQEDGTIIAETQGEDDQGPKTFFVRDGVLFVDIGWCCGHGGVTIVADGAWHHVVFTAEIGDGDDVVKYYVDGELDTEGALDVNAFPEAEFPLWIGFDGRADPGEFPPFIGIIDEVSVYSRALSASEIRQNFAADSIAAVDPAEKLSVTWGTMKVSR